MPKPRSTSGKNGYGLVADIGGTHVRFALTGLGRPAPAASSIRVLATRDHADIAAAARAYLAELRCKSPPEALVFAVAGPVTDNEVYLTNAGWRISGDRLKKALKVRSATVINDFEAIAWAVEHLGSGDLMVLGNKPFAPKGQGTVAIIGPGTGLGVAGFVRSGKAGTALVTEGGHVAFAPADETEIRILQILGRRFGRVSAERILSGPGLLNLYGALAEIEGVSATDATPETITRVARENARSFEAKVFARFCGILGAVAGDFALAFGARRGVLIAGVILPVVRDLLAASDFRKRFEDKARFAGYVKPIPTALIVQPRVGLIGAAAVLLERLRA